MMATSSDDEYNSTYLPEAELGIFDDNNLDLQPSTSLFQQQQQQLNISDNSESESERYSEEQEPASLESALDRLRALRFPKPPDGVNIPKSTIALRTFERERFLKSLTKTYDIDSPHKDQIYHISLNETGDRMALCGGDQTVSVWDRHDDGTWTKAAFWKTHGGAIWRVVWAHPDFGQILATCSFDRNINIFKEDIMEDEEHVNEVNDGRQRTREKEAIYGEIGKKKDFSSKKANEEKYDRIWIKQAALRDSRENITDLQFGPRHIGLCLASVSAAGNLRVYEVTDQRELRHWDLVHETQIISARLSCVAWSRSRIHRPNVFMGSDEPDMGNYFPRVVIYECNDLLREWRRLHSVQLDVTEPVTDIQISPCYRVDGFQFVVAAGDIHVYDFILPSRNLYIDEATKAPSRRTSKTIPNEDYELRKLCHLGDMRKAWRIRYNVTGNVLTASSADGCVRVWKALFHNQWALLTELSADDYLHSRQITNNMDDDEYIIE